MRLRAAATARAQFDPISLECFHHLGNLLSQFLLFLPSVVFWSVTLPSDAVISAELAVSWLSPSFLFHNPVDDVAFFSVDSYWGWWKSFSVIRIITGGFKVND